jgi:hypothetical protein
MAALRPQAGEVKGSRRALLPVLILLGFVSVLSCASWFRTMEVSAPHIVYSRHQAQRLRPPDGAGGARANGAGGAGGVAGGGERPVGQPAGGANAFDPTKCVVSRTVPTISDCLLRPLAKDNVVINSVADKKYSLYAINYVRALGAAGITNFIMGALDTELLATFQKMGAPAFSLANITQGAQWHATNRHKIRVVLGFIEVGVGILFTDVDVMFIQDPMPFISTWPQADQLISSDMQEVRRSRVAPRAQPRPLRHMRACHCTLTPWAEALPGLSARVASEPQRAAWAERSTEGL